MAMLEQDWWSTVVELQGVGTAYYVQQDANGCDAVRLVVASGPVTRLLAERSGLDDLGVLKAQRDFTLQALDLIDREVLENIGALDAQQVQR